MVISNRMATAERAGGAAVKFCHKAFSAGSVRAIQRRIIMRRSFFQLTVHYLSY
ncbi:hypothetical protein DDI_1529 [Dickeya dianthicola RNS04.9]|nr:hypothetical protein DDI_1529 [Dickeya dianthicola RNS04.9]